MPWLRFLCPVQWNLFSILIEYLLHHHHYHHVQEGLGLIPVPCILKIKLVPPLILTLVS